MSSKRVKFLAGWRAILLHCCFAVLAFAGLHAFAETVSVGTKLEIRLQQPISSYATKKGSRVSGVLVAPLTEDGAYAASSRNHRRRLSGGGQEGGSRRRS